MAIAICPAPFVICWQQRTNGDESTHEQRVLTSRADAELALECIVQDLANDDVRCSWLDPTLLTELEAIPF